MVKPRGFRKASSYLSRSPELRAKQLANLKQGKEKLSLSELIKTEKKLRDLKIIEFCEEHIHLPEKDQLIILEDWERKVFRDCFYEKRPRLIVISTGKKNGKSTAAAAILTWFLITQEPGELYICSNSRDQSDFVTFRKVKKMIQRDRELAKMCRIYSDYIENVKTGSLLRCLPSSFRSSAGLNCLLICIDELSSFDTDSLKFFFDELQLSPTYKFPAILITSTAGREETGLLWDLIRESEKGNTPENYYFVKSGSEANPSSFVTQKYLDSQEHKPGMRKNLFLRLHKNLWVSEEDSFISDQDYRACIDYSLIRRPKGKIPVWIGLDVGYRNDYTGIYTVGKNENKLFSVDHKIYVPVAGNDLQFDDVKRYFLELAKLYDIKAVAFDPFQAIQLSQDLRKEHINMVELPQSQNNCIAFSQCLFDLIKNKRISFYQSEEIRQSLINCKVVYSSRGWRIVKKGTGKIDLAIAGAMSCFIANLAEDSGVRVRSLEDNIFDDDDFESVGNLIPETYSQI